MFRLTTVLHIHVLPALLEGATTQLGQKGRTITSVIAPPRTLLRGSTQLCCATPQPRNLSRTDRLSGNPFFFGKTRGGVLGIGSMPKPVESPVKRRVSRGRIRRTPELQPLVRPHPITSRVKMPGLSAKFVAGGGRWRHHMGGRTGDPG